MTPRDRFQKIMRFQKPDRAPLWDLEGITEGAVRQWCIDGFPPGRTVHEFIGFDAYERVALSTGPIPSFVPRTIDEDDETVTTIDQYGFKIKTLKERAVPPTTYYYIEGSVKTRQDWQEMKRRYDPRDIRRRPSHWGEELFEYLRMVDRPVSLTIVWGPGRGPKNGYMLGQEEFLEALTGQQALIHDIFDFWADFVIELVRELLENAPIDFVWLSEDGIAYRNSTVISPAMYRELWHPYVRRVTDFLRSHGVDIIGHYTSGNITPLIPSFLDAGINLFGPLECAADMDAVGLRKEYGKDVLLMGNISRASLMAGPDAVEEEFNRKVPWLMDQGGYIPAIDDMILPDISFASMMKYVELIRGFEIGNARKQFSG
ncbi:MAG: uroporphyrinogen decarboxylase family protein [Planctomycetota bacterium]|jgi:uroporphyrinogen decarboxylase|nr:uroporphyrinogen decarboxylase family protein [Planctomycetota bacterium]